jgi:hypothetical protein
MIKFDVFHSSQKLSKDPEMKTPKIEKTQKELLGNI